MLHLPPKKGAIKLLVLFLKFLIKPVSKSHNPFFEISYVPLWLITHGQ